MYQNRPQNTSKAICIKKSATEHIQGYNPIEKHMQTQNHRKKTLKTHSLTHPILKHPQNPKKLPPLLKGTDAQSGTTHKNPPSFTN